MKMEYWSLYYRGNSKVPTNRNFTQWLQTSEFKSNNNAANVHNTLDGMDETFITYIYQQNQNAP